MKGFAGMRRLPWAAGPLLLALVAARPAAGQDPRGMPPQGGVTDAPADAHRITVVVRDSRTGVAVAGALLHVEGVEPVITDSLGRASLRLSRSHADLTITHPWYLRWRGQAGAGSEVSIRLNAVPVQLDTMLVRTRAMGAGEAFQATAVIGSTQLAERMAPSIAAIVSVEPGITARTNGPMASQPVIRGLSGDRVLVLEDGLRTGDIATTAPDHAITIEPATARRIEVIRGPAGLLYGSNTLGGVVNVVREDVPRSRVARRSWLLSGYGESVNRGVGGSGRVQGNAGPLVWQVDGSARTAGDTRTPGGVPLPYTDLDGADAGAGIALVSDAGFAGFAVRDYRTFYGVPSSFGGATLPGAHDGGVYIDVRRSTMRMDGEWRRDRGFVEAVSLGANGVRFEQSEFEEGGIVGTRFGQLAASGEAVARLRFGRHRSVIGVASQWRDLRAEGSFTGTRPAVQRTIAIFAVEELDAGKLTVLAGLRGEHILVEPLDLTESLLLRDVRAREFSALTGAIGVRAALGRNWVGTIQLARAFRPPSIEELYSAGPHLASYAYEIGLPTLAAETGAGLDAVLRWQGVVNRIEVAAYGMRVRDHISFAPQIDSLTGLPMRDPRLRRYVVYRPRQDDARLAGFEGRATFMPAAGWILDLSADLPRGQRVDGVPLPYMPGGGTRLQVRRIGGSWSIGANGETRFAQRRVPPAPVSELTCDVVVRDGEAISLPAEFCPTDAVLLIGASGSVRLPPLRVSPWPATLTVSVDNLLDTRWRDPLWRAGLVAPQPGRNLRVGLQVSP